MVEPFLDDAVRAGKIPPERVPVYRTMYDRNPRGTASLINSLAPGVPPVAAATLAEFAGEQSPYPRELFPELARRPRAALGPAPLRVEEPPSIPSPASAEARLPETSAVAGLAEQLFPEVRERRAQQGSRVTWADR